MQCFNKGESNDNVEIESSVDVEDLNKLDSYLPETERSTSNVSGSGSVVETSVLDEILSVESGNSISGLIRGSGTSEQLQKEVPIFYISFTGALMKSKIGLELL